MYGGIALESTSTWRSNIITPKKSSHHQ